MCLNVDIGEKGHLISAIVLPNDQSNNFQPEFFPSMLRFCESPGIFYFIFKLKILITVDLIIILTLKQLLILLTKELSLHTLKKYFKQLRNAKEWKL